MRFLFCFLFCAQLEHAEHAQRAPIQELVYERPYIVLPPLIEWVRVASAHAEHRHSSVLDKDDVAQAARLLLPGVDCPIRAYGYVALISHPTVLRLYSIIIYPYSAA